jgi:hypothetical protein
MQLFEVRKETEKAGEVAPVWTYVAADHAAAAAQHIQKTEAGELNRYPDFLSVMTVEPLGKPSRIDGRQLWEARLRTNRRGQINAWRVERYFVRPISANDIDLAMAIQSESA